MGSLCLFGPSVRHSEGFSGRSAVILACGLLVYTCKVPWLPAVTATPSHAQTLDLQLRDRAPLSLSLCNDMESLRYPCSASVRIDLREGVRGLPEGARASSRQEFP